MFSGPMFRRERLVETRKRRTFVIRIVFTVGLAIIGLLIGLIIFKAQSQTDTQTRLLYLGRALLIATIVFELLCLLFFVPAYVGERSPRNVRKTRSRCCSLTRLTPIEIVLTKMVARWLAAANMVVIAIPMLVAAAFLAGLERESVLALLVLLSSSMFMASLTILASAQREQLAMARGSRPAGSSAGSSARRSCRSSPSRAGRSGGISSSS